MKTLIAILVLSLVSFSAQAKKVSHKDIKNLIHRMEVKKAKSLRISTKLVNFWIAPDAPKAGESVTIFAQNETGFTDSEIIMEGSFDGQNGVILENPAKELWIYEAGSFTEQRSYTFTAKVFIQDKNEAKQIRDAISSLEAEIASLNQQIEDATDPQLIAELTAIRDEKVNLKNELVEALANLKTAIGEESFTFSVGEGTDPSLPRITSVNPDTGASQGGDTISIFGDNFGSNPEVKFGGQLVASVVSVTPSVIQVVTPNFLENGAKDVEVRFSENGKIKNSIRRNGFYATPFPIGTPAAPPVAIAGPSQSINLGESAQFSGAASYDPNAGDTFGYEWRVISKPRGSAIVVPSNPPGNQVGYSFSPDVPGTYVLSLEVFDLNSSLRSAPSLTVLNVSSPANRAPIASASSISTGTNSVVTRQIQVSDPDTWQTRSFFITKQPAIGSASVSSTGLVTYQAGASEGQDSIHILVVDNGTPQLSAQVVIDVNQINNLAPVVGDLLAFTLSRGLPYNVVLLANAPITDPDGTIASMRWEFGDGTSEKVITADAGITHNYIQAGTYTATLRVTDNLGTEVSKSFQVNVVDTDIPKPKFKISTFTGSAPLTVNFDASEASDSDGIVSYVWNWGSPGAANNEIVAVPTISHTFSDPGVYPVTFYAIDANGAMGISTVYIFVDPPFTLPVTEHSPVPLFETTPNRRAILGQSHTFDATNSFSPNVGGTINDYEWNFDDYLNCPNGCVENGLNTLRTRTYGGVGNYYPSLKVSGPDGYKAFTFGQEVYVVNAGFGPKAILAADVIEGTAPLSVQFTSESYDYDGQISLTQWSSGDGSCTVNCSAEGGSFPYTYTQPGVYFASVTVTDADGNQNTAFQTIEVSGSKKAKFSSALNKRTNAPGNNPNREDNRRALTTLCAKGQGSACFFLAKMYEEDGNLSLAQKLKQKSCGLGFQEACGKVRW